MIFSRKLCIQLFFKSDFKKILNSQPSNLKSKLESETLGLFSDLPSFQKRGLFTTLLSETFYAFTLNPYTLPIQKTLCVEIIQNGLGSKQNSQFKMVAKSLRFLIQMTSLMLILCRLFSRTSISRNSRSQYSKILSTYLYLQFWDLEIGYSLSTI